MALVHAPRLFVGRCPAPGRPSRCLDDRLRYTRSMAIAHEGGWFSRLARGLAGFVVRGRPNPRMLAVRGRPNPRMLAVRGRPNPRMLAVRGRPNPRMGWLGLALVFALATPACGYNEV